MLHCIIHIIIPPASTKLIGGILVSPCPSVRPSVCPSVRLWTKSCPLCIFNNTQFWRIFIICNFDFVIFWLGIQYDSMVWVIMRRRGVSSERRRSSYSYAQFALLRIWLKMALQPRWQPRRPHLNNLDLRSGYIVYVKIVLCLNAPWVKHFTPNCLLQMLAISLRSQYEIAILLRSTNAKKY